VPGRSPEAPTPVKAEGTVLGTKPEPQASENIVQLPELGHSEAKNAEKGIEKFIQSSPMRHDFTSDTEIAVICSDNDLF
jgi:hypothetical protein